MHILNFSHPLSEDAVQQLTERFGEPQIRNIRVQLDMSQPLEDQVRQVVDSVGFAPAEWQTLPFAVVLPGASVATALVLAEVHGRSGGFPLVVVLSPGQDRVFRVSEVINLHDVRGRARVSR